MLHPCIHLLLLLEADQLLVSDLIYVGLLFTFGAAFPPLAVALIITLTTRLYLRNVTVGRFVTICIEKRLFTYVDIVEEECRDLPLMETLRKCWLIIVVLSSSFYSLFLFDTLGSSSSSSSSSQVPFWIMIVVPGIPCIAFMLSKWVWVVQCYKEGMRSSAVAVALAVSARGVKEERSEQEQEQEELQSTKEQHVVPVMDVVVGNPMIDVREDDVKDGVELAAVVHPSITINKTHLNG